MSYTLTLERSEFSVTWLPPKPPVSANFEADLKNNRSRGKRGLRSLARFLIALWVGIAAILAWQPDSDAAREMIAGSSPQLAWVAPPATPLAETADDGSASGAIPSDDQRLRAMSLDLASMRQSIDELIANQEQMAREMTRLRETERYVLSKMSVPLPRPAPARTRMHASRPSTTAGPNIHHAATSSTSSGSSSPLPALLTRFDTGHKRTRSSAADLRSSAPELFSQSLMSALSRITGIRL